jgi:hypothetical protein
MANTPPSKMDAYWMPFTANRQFKKNTSYNESGQGDVLHLR